MSDGKPQVGEVYRHYKGGIYSVVGRSIDEPTCKELVTYREYAKANVSNETRTVEDFLAEVEVAGVKQPRFKQISLQEAVQACYARGDVTEAAKKGFNS